MVSSKNDAQCSFFYNKTAYKIKMLNKLADNFTPNIWYVVGLSNDYS